MLTLLECTHKIEVAGSLTDFTTSSLVFRFETTLDLPLLNYVEVVTFVTLMENVLAVVDLYHF